MKYAKYVALSIIFAVCNANADERTDFVNLFMKTQLTETKDQYSRMDAVRFISKEFLRKHQIDPFFIQLNTYRIDDYEILNQHGDYIDVLYFIHTCNSCWADQVMKLKVVEQDSGYAIEPHDYQQGSEYLDYWYQRISGKYDLN